MTEAVTMLNVIAIASLVSEIWKTHTHTQSWLSSIKFSQKIEKRHKERENERKEGRKEGRQKGTKKDREKETGRQNEKTTYLDLTGTTPTEDVLGFFMSEKTTTIKQHIRLRIHVYYGGCS